MRTDVKSASRNHDFPGGRSRRRRRTSSLDRAHGRKGRFAQLLKNWELMTASVITGFHAQVFRTQGHMAASHGPSGGTINVGIIAEFVSARISPILIGECSYWVRLSFRVVTMVF